MRLLTTLIATASITLQAAEAQDDPGLPRLPKPVIVAEALAGKLVRLEGGEFADHKLNPEQAIDYFLLYFSAGWNPACVKFTPALVKFYNEQKAAGANFEIVLVSADDSEAEMKRYMAEADMPWPALRFADRGGEGLEFVDAAAGRGVPCLAVLDSRGLILAHSYRRRKEYLGAEEPLAEFAKLLEEAAAKREAAGERAE